MPGEHATLFQIRSYQMNVSAPAYSYRVPKELIVVVDIPADAQYLYGGVVGDLFTMKFMVDTTQKNKKTRFLLLAEGQLTARQDIESFVGYITFTWGSRAIFILGDNA